MAILALGRYSGFALYLHGRSPLPPFIFLINLKAPTAGSIRPDRHCARTTPGKKTLLLPGGGGASGGDALLTADEASSFKVKHRQFAN